MGMYTELVLSCRIKNDSTVVEVLQYMVEGKTQGTLPATLPNHPLFDTSRWDWMFHSCSHYFTPVSVQQLSYDDIGKHWCLVVRCDLKNYDSEIEHLIDWLSPYVVDEGFRTMIGYSRYEEADEPTIHYAGSEDEA